MPTNGDLCVNTAGALLGSRSLSSRGTGCWAQTLARGYAGFGYVRRTRSLHDGRDVL